MATSPSEAQPDAPRSELTTDRRSELNNMKPTIASILGIQDLSTFDVLSAVNELYLVHYIPGPAHAGASLGELLAPQGPRLSQANVVSPRDMDARNIRGVIVDVVAQVVVCASFGYTPTANVGELKLSEDGHYHIVDTDGIHHNIDPTQTSIRLGYEGTIMRVFKHGGTVYHSTHRRIDSSRSRWGNSPSFKELYHQLKGPTDEELFSPESTHSPYVYIFLIVHPSVLVATKESVGEGYIVYLGAKIMWETSPYPGATLDLEQKLPTGDHLRSPRELTLEEANHHLQYGYSQAPDAQGQRSNTEDIRLRPGEFIMLYYQNEEGHQDLLKVQGIPYWWRSNIRNNDPNLLHRFYQLVDWSYLHTENPPEWNQYIGMFPMLERKELTDIVTPISFSQRTNISTAVSREDRLHNIWQCYLMAVPLHCQREVVTMYLQFLQDRTDLIEWVHSLNDILPPDTPRQTDNSVGPTSPPEVSERITAIISSARRFAKERRRTHRNMSRNGHILGIRAMTRDNIRNLLMKEKGASLYRLVKEMHSQESRNDADQST